MFDDAKYMAKDAVDRNNAIGALDQQLAEEKVYSWARKVSVRRGIAVLLAFATAALPLVTALNNSRVFLVFVLAWIGVLALTRTAMRAGRAEPIGRMDFVVLAGLAIVSTAVALSAQTDVNLQAGPTATAGIALAVLAALPAAPAIVRCWR